MLTVRIERPPTGPRLHIGAYRIHHYHAGLALLALACKLIWHDRADLPHRHPMLTKLLLAQTNHPHETTQATQTPPSPSRTAPSV